MAKQDKHIDLYREGCETYAFVGGGKRHLLRLEDNTDLVTDVKREGVPVKPTNVKQEIKFMPRGRNDNLCYEVMKRIGSNVTVGSNVEHKMKIIVGDGVQVMRKRRNEQGKIVTEEVLEQEQPDIFAFLADNDYNQLRMELANDLFIFGEAYVEYVFNREEHPRLVQLKAKEATCSRVSQISEQTQRIEWHGYSAQWSGGGAADVVATPLLDRQYALADIKERMGLRPNRDGEVAAGRDRRFVHNLRINTPGRFYYERPYWWSVFRSGWYDFSTAIPILKRALIKNQMNIRYVVYIKKTFWDALYKEMGIYGMEKRQEQIAAKGEFLKSLEDFLAGEENAGKAFVSEFAYDKVGKGGAEKDVIIEQLTANKGGEYIDDSEEANNTICYAMGVHPSIIGASPGKSKTISGTEARELYIMEQAMMKYYQDLTLAPLYIAKAVNGWPADICFGVVNCQLTTLDKGSGAVKNAGIKPEGE